MWMSWTWRKICGWIAIGWGERVERWIWQGERMPLVVVRGEKVASFEPKKFIGEFLRVIFWLPPRMPRFFSKERLANPIKAPLFFLNIIPEKNASENLPGPNRKGKRLPLPCPVSRIPPPMVRGSRWEMFPKMSEQFRFSTYRKVLPRIS